MTLHVLRIPEHPVLLTWLLILAYTSPEPVLNLLQQKLEKSAFSISRRMVGQIRKCLVTGVSKKNPGEFQARADNNKVVIFACNDESLIGDFVDIEIVEAKNKSIRGLLVA